jgi:hypothetical protein
MILKNERDKAFMSIHDISQEIQNMKSKAKKFEVLIFLIGEMDHNTRNKSSDYQNIEFQGSFGCEELSRRLKNEGHIKLNLPKISLDNVLDLQKSESFVNRCNKRKICDPYSFC